MILLANKTVESQVFELNDLLLNIFPKFLLYPHYWLLVSLFLILGQKLIISKDSLTNNVQQFR